MAILFCRWSGAPHRDGGSPGDGGPAPRHRVRRCARSVGFSAGDPQRIGGGRRWPRPLGGSPTPSARIRSATGTGPPGPTGCARPGKPVRSMSARARPRAPSGPVRCHRRHRRRRGPAVDPLRTHRGSGRPASVLASTPGRAPSWTTAGDGSGERRCPAELDDDVTTPRTSAATRTDRTAEFADTHRRWRRDDPSDDRSPSSTPPSPPRSPTSPSRADAHACSAARRLRRWLRASQAPLHLSGQAPQRSNASGFCTTSDPVK